MKISLKNANTNVPCEPYYSFVLSWMLDYLRSFSILEVKCQFLLLIKNRKYENKQFLPLTWKNGKIYLIKRKKIESKKGEMLRMVSQGKVKSSVLVWYMPLFLNEMVIRLMRKALLMSM